ncbi:hypothetical protein OF829_11340 [Sphingomonas sp. LB-2]|uniref:hypothetical protein n=1 Tax=Sphingomonas caeni TaxID=2984949 RepID=UPI002230BC13|nr:hypothetical protein [Sphingomonas caeni]MCW3847834.1 hypothetical protein [Sphingomonas caeni]
MIAALLLFASSTMPPDVTFDCRAATSFRVYVPGNGFTLAYRIDDANLRANLPALVQPRRYAYEKLEGTLSSGIVYTWKNPGTNARLRLVIRNYDGAAASADYAIETATADNPNAFSQALSGTCSATFEPRDVPLELVSLEKVSIDRGTYGCFAPDSAGGGFRIVTIEKTDDINLLEVGDIRAEIEEISAFRQGKVIVLKLVSGSNGGIEFTMRRVDFGYDSAELVLNDGKEELSCSRLPDMPAPAS